MIGGKARKTNRDKIEKKRRETSGGRTEEEDEE